MNPKDALTAALSDWLASVLPRLDSNQKKAFEEMLADQLDVRVVIRLRKGTVCVDAVKVINGKEHFGEIYREDIEPLRPRRTEVKPT